MPPDEAAIPTLPHDLPPPEFYLPVQPWWQDLLIALPVLALILLAAVFADRKFKLRARFRPLPEPPAARAIAQLQTLEKEKDTLALSTLAAQCSLIFRSYLLETFQIGSPAQTEEEAELPEDFVSQLPPELSHSLITFRKDLPALKYVPLSPSPEKAQSLLDQTHSLIDALHQHQLREADSTPDSSAP